MRIIIMMIFLLQLFKPSFAQDHHQEKIKIKEVVQQFMQSTPTKDSATFNSLFHEQPVLWVGVLTDKTQGKILE